ncbi:hypothetical protein M5D96_003042 [Drosophila gunungcola]|uniref:Uncharacterized protein n=1 Tax=Drosophila gunungcola TaxID=103775 RepID=A0A9P9Z1P1_9MUSC|nr:hypothetical protein M5D96_003042 [Drosophila gunungcola]
MSARRATHAGSWYTDSVMGPSEVLFRIGAHRIADLVHAIVGYLGGPAQALLQIAVAPSLLTQCIQAVLKLRAGLKEGAQLRNVTELTGMPAESLRRVRGQLVQAILQVALVEHLLQLLGGRLAQLVVGVVQVQVPDAALQAREVHRLELLANALEELVALLQLHLHPLHVVVDALGPMGFQELGPGTAILGRSLMAARSSGFEREAGGSRSRIRVLFLGISTR